MTLEDAIRIEPIGIVKNEFKDHVPEGYEDRISEIIIHSEFLEGLHLLNENSHIVVVFWMNRVDEENRGIMRMHPKGREDLPLLGVFATRSPRRPNPIGIRAVRLIEIINNIIRVEGLDALNETPVLDIKPYSKKHDHVKDAKSPSWARDQRDGKGEI